MVCSVYEETERAGGKYSPGIRTISEEEEVERRRRRRRTGGYGLMDLLLLLSPIKDRQRAPLSSFLLRCGIRRRFSFFPRKCIMETKLCKSVNLLLPLACLCLPPASLPIPAPPRLVTQETNSVFFFFAGGGGGGGVINGSCYSFPPLFEKVSNL